MSTLAELYCNNLHRNFQELFATWPVGAPVQLGDYGQLRKNNVFRRLGNISQLGIAIGEARLDDANDDFEYKSASSVTVRSEAKGTIASGGAANAKARLSISFSGDESIFFLAANCTYRMVDNIAALGREVMRRFEAKEWDPSHVVVTSVLDAGATTVIISDAVTASIELEAESDAVDVIDLGAANVGLSVRSESNIGLKVVTRAGMTPLMGLAQVQPKFRVGPISIGGRWGLRGARRFGPGLSRALDGVDIAAMRDASAQQGIAAEDAFYFGALRSREE